jgi:hypothetical protein
MTTELDILRYQEQQERIVSMRARGVPLTEIQKQTGLSRRDIEQHLADFRDFARNDKYMVGRSREVVLTVDQHYSDIIQQYYEAIQEANLADDYKAKMAGLSAVAKIESDRVEFLRKAGLIAESHVGDMVAAAEEKQAILVGILKTIAKKYPEVAKEITFELSKVTGDVEPVSVIDG